MPGENSADDGVEERLISEEYKIESTDFEEKKDLQL